MFLNQLTLLEKESFLALSVKGAEANDEITVEEYAMLEEYCKEMGIAFFDTRNVKEMEQLVAIFRDSEESHKRIVLLELLGLLHADGKFDEKEERFAKDFAKEIGLEEKEINTLRSLLEKYLTLVKEISLAVE